MIKTDITVCPKYTEEEIKNAVISRLGIEKNEISELRIIKRAPYLKDKGNMCYKMTVALKLCEEREKGLLKMPKKVSSYEPFSFTPPASRLKTRPVVVGAGPCGLFAALTLAKAGARPILLERGLSVEQREEKVSRFITSAVLDEECNVQFGEGGAGTYSDGKLKVGALDKYKHEVLSEFCEAGAGSEIMYSTDAHLGTDKLPDIVRNIRRKIIHLGGEVIFSARLTEIKCRGGAVSSVIYERGEREEEIPTDNVILATGHSAKDVFYMLEKLCVPMTAKGFGVGVRIEHPREYINDLIYGKDKERLFGTASYHLVTHLPSGRSVYSFCMCPGGSVVPAASEAGGIVTNGMSEYKRDADNSNAAILVSVSPSDFPSDNALSGIDFQRAIERCAYNLTASYKAPAIRLDDFMKKGASRDFASVKPSYKRGVEIISPDEYLPSFITDSLRDGIEDFDRWLPGYNYSEATLTGPETRTTSPVRILRAESFEALGISGLYPAGEGAGYAGGIVSSATDGVRTAEAMLLKN